MTDTPTTEAVGDPVDNTPAADAASPPAAEPDYVPSQADYAALESQVAAQDADDTTEPDDGGDIAKARRQAANYRTRLRDAEAERDVWRECVSSQVRSVIDWRAANHPSGSVDAALLDAAGLDMGEMVDESGIVDMAKVDHFIEDTAARFNLRRAFKPNRAQGQGDSPDPRPSLADAFRRK